MVNVRFIERRGAVLTPSALACLSGVPSVNISCGCARGCAYCYTRPYPKPSGVRDSSGCANWGPRTASGSTSAAARTPTSQRTGAI